MEDKIKKCKDMLLGLDKLSINELNYLLINKSRENQNKFILGFMHYIFSMAYSLYQKRPSYFRDGYDFEEFFSDGIMIAITNYNKFSYGDVSKKYDYFFNFCNIFRLHLSSKLVNQYFLKVHRATLYKIKKIISLKQKILRETKRVISDKELIEKYCFSEHYVKKAYFDVPIDECHLKVSDNMIIEKIFQKDMQEDLRKALDELDERYKKVICELYAIDGEEKKSGSQIAKELSVSRGRVYQIRDTSFNKVHDSHLELKNYLTE